MRFGEPAGTQAPQTLTLKTNRDRRNCGSRRGRAASCFYCRRPLSPWRSGLVYAARFRILALEEMKKATLVLDQGWADGYTVNGQAPQPVTQRSADGRLVYGLGHIPAGHALVFWLSLQVNPTTVGRHRQSVSLSDGQRLLATVHRSVFVFP